MIVIILAGGEGSRLWPLSTPHCPKQFLSFNPPLSLLQKTISRFVDNPLFKTILIATNAHVETLVKEHVAHIGASHRCTILVEPMRKNTAPALAFAIKYLEEKCNAAPNDLVLVLPSDHLIEPEREFVDAVLQTDQCDGILTFGIRPTKPESGYGYIQVGEAKNATTYHIKRFVEKPDRETAKQYIASRQYLWNAGLFLFAIETFWQQLASHAPAIFALAKRGYESARAGYEQFPNISIDCAVMEQCQNSFVYPLTVSWFDVGSWDSVYDALEKDAKGNVKQGTVRECNTTDSLIISTHRPVVTLDISDLLIIETSEAIFIGKKGSSQHLKQLMQ